jgi:hypothetical protein
MQPRMFQVVSLFLIAAAALAQSDRGTITGTVTDQANAVVPNAAIVATNKDTGAHFETATTGTGNYTLPQLPAGEYDLSVAAPGFGNFVQKGITDCANRCIAESRSSHRICQRNGRRPVAEDGERGAEHQSYD